MNRNARQPCTAPTVLFLHIPKAGGRSLYKALERNYAANDTYCIGVNTASAMQKFINLPLQHRARIRLVRGHMPFGLHDHIPRNAVYITLLRDPVERVISHYYYVKRTPEHYLHSDITEHDTGLHDYITSSGCPELDNGQTRLLAGVDDNIPFGELDDTILEKAQNNLHASFAAVGLTERFDETLLLFRKRLRWHALPLYAKQNVTRNRPPRDATPPATLRQIRTCNMYDQRLYDEAASGFDKQVQDAVSQSALAAFRLLNLTYGAAYRVAHRLREAKH